MRVDPIILCAAGVLLPVVTYIAMDIANGVVASRSSAPDQNFMVLSFLVFLASIAGGIGLVTLGVALMLRDRERRAWGRGPRGPGG